jgi:heme-degrading monooxygenase HmoA
VDSAVKSNGGIERVILEVAVLNIKTGLTAEFEAAFKVASAIIAAMPGYISHELQHCLENCDSEALP